MFKKFRTLFKNYQDTPPPSAHFWISHWCFHLPCLSGHSSWPTCSLMERPGTWQPPTVGSSPASKTCWPNPHAVSMLGQRRRRWPNIETTNGFVKHFLEQHFVNALCFLEFLKITNWPSVVLSLCHRYHVGSAINQPWANVWRRVDSCYLFAPDTITQDTSSVPALLSSIPEKKPSHKNPLAIIDSAPSAIFQFCWYLPVNRPIKSKWMLQISINGG